MISRFVNLFKSSDHDEVRAFQMRLVGLLTELYPDKKIKPSDDPHVIDFESSTCGLQNIQAKFLASSGTEDDLKAILREYFDVFAHSQILDDRFEISWEAAKPNVMPQLMPAEFQVKIPLVHDEFLDGLLLGFVVDTEKAYSYISASDIERWGIEISEIRDAAFENLKERSSEMPMNAFPRPNGFIVINSMDGFDAVRIMSEEMRHFVGDFVGMPFYFGIPNRDFLICWEASEDVEFHGRFVEQISSDFDQQPYPLSRKPFRVDFNGNIVEVDGHADPRADAAMLN